VASRLPDNPSLERLRAEARRLQAGIASQGPSALAVVADHHPRPDRALSTGRLALHDAHLTVARRYGFPGWPALVHHLQVAAPMTVDPGRVAEDRLEPADLFCALSSLRYDHTDAPPRRELAADLLAVDGHLPERHVWAAASAADVGALRAHLAVDPAAVGARGGPFGWQPLLYLCYSRLPVSRSAADPVAAARLLLDAGADPNAGYLWCGLATPFTALTGVFGEGEQGAARQPRHPHDVELADLLLEHGAHPVDQQTLYNRMFRRDDAHLEQLFAHGLADAGPSPWEQRLGAALETREEMWQRQVRWAVEHGFTERLALLGRHGIDIGIVQPVAATDDADAVDGEGATALHRAAWDGDVDAIRRLLAAGADPTVTDAQFGATPLGWAEHAYQTEAAELLRPFTSDS
jgi:hypothetical protein